MSATCRRRWWVSDILLFDRLDADRASITTLNILECGPSLKTCPRWPPQRRQWTSVRTKKNKLRLQAAGSAAMKARRLKTTRPERRKALPAARRRKVVADAAKRSHQDAACDRRSVLPAPVAQ
jgi:hypothetical protein